MMERIGMRIVTALLAIMTLTLLGCPKKAPPPEPGPAAITTSTQPAARPSGGGLSGGSASPADTARREEGRLAALRGEDVPLESRPDKAFGDPSPEEMRILRPIYFDYDRSEIKGEYRAILDGIGQWMKDNPGRQVLVEGHCDERGTNEYNLALGERRALSVRRYLVALGIEADRLHTISYGEEKPADAGHDEAAWSKNRRAEFKVSARE